MLANLRRRSNSQNFPSCVGGLNDRDSIADMDAVYALSYDNVFPGTNDSVIRGGCTEFATGLSTTGESLLGYNGIAGSKLFAASGANIYNITAGGAVGAAIATGFTNARWDHINFGGAAGNFLVAVNGTNLPQFYDGTTWTASGVGFATAITGATATNFSQVNVWKNRLFFVEKNTLKCWYLGVQAIGGAATAIDFAGVAKLGGKLIATATVSSTAGSTVEDYFVAITSEGELLVYAGTDPASAATFALVGNFRIGRPIANGADNQGGRFMARFGSNVIVLTMDGFFNLQDALNIDVVASRAALSDKIINSVSSDVNNYKSNFGWQAMLMPAQNKLFINVPTTELQASKQYVMNTITGAFCTYSGWNLTTLLYWQDNLYGIIGTKVYILDVKKSNDFATAADVGTAITGTIRTAFQYNGGKGQLKNYKFVRPLFFGSGIIQPSVSLDTDFKNLGNLGTPSVSTGTNSKWGTAKWGTAKWGSDSFFTQNWISVNGIGYCASLNMKITTSQQECRWQGFDIIWEKGGLI